MKNNLIYFLCGLITLMTIASAFAYTEYYQDDTGYIIEVETHTSWWDILKGALSGSTQQSIYAEKTTVMVGDSVKVHIVPILPETFNGKPYTIDTTVSKILVVKPNGETKSFRFPTSVAPGKSVPVYITQTPDMSGTWKVYYAIMSGNPFGSNALTQSQRISGETISFTVTANNPVCKETNKLGDYKFFANIPNGKVDQRTNQRIGTDCKQLSSTIEYRTTCDTGYQIKGTTGEVSNTYTSCVKIPIILPQILTWVIKDNTCVLRQTSNGYSTEAKCKLALDIPDPEITSWFIENDVCVEKVSSEGYANKNECQSNINKLSCTEDETLECPDGTTIITVKCVNGQPQQLINSCPYIPPPCTENCGSSSSSSSSGGGNGGEFDIKDHYLELGIIIAVLLIIMVIIVRREKQ